MTDDARDLVDLARYPIDDRNDPRRAELVARCRAELDARNLCVVPNFITEAARRQMVDDAMALLPEAYPNSSHRTCFLKRQPDPSKPADHPNNIFFDAKYRMMAYDLFGPEQAMPRLYKWAPLRELIGEIVGVEPLHLNVDPYQPANVLCYGDGDRSTWHFDHGNEFTVTIMLQSSDGGGVFEIAPEIIDRDDPSLRRLTDVLLDRSDEVNQVGRSPGSLVIFRGDRSVHRVSPVEGDTLRLMAVFVYEPKPGVVGLPEVNATIYGPRVEQAGKPA